MMNAIEQIEDGLSFYKRLIRWIKKSPWAWFGLILLAFLALYVLQDYLEDKQDEIHHFVKKVRSPKQLGQTEKDNEQEKIGDQEPKESKGERASRAAAERIFKKPFIKVRPDFLRNVVTNHNLELDVYNEELKLAIEYSGRQHYEFVPFFHKNYEAFLNQKYRDEMKKNKCKEQGIHLIEIPYTVKLEDIESFIRIESKKIGYDI
jgi:hypothetical protein